jgi:hypothetical protein
LFNRFWINWFFSTLCDSRLFSVKLLIRKWSIVLRFRYHLFLVASLFVFNFDVNTTGVFRVCIGWLIWLYCKLLLNIVLLLIQISGIHFGKLSHILIRIFIQLVIRLILYFNRCVFNRLLILLICMSRYWLVLINYLKFTLNMSTKVTFSYWLFLFHIWRLIHCLLSLVLFAQKLRRWILGC